MQATTKVIKVYCVESSLHNPNIVTQNAKKETLAGHPKYVTEKFHIGLHVMYFLGIVVIIWIKCHQLQLLCPLKQLHALFVVAVLAFHSVSQKSSRKKVVEKKFFGDGTQDEAQQEVQEEVQTVVTLCRWTYDRDAKIVLDLELNIRSRRCTTWNAHESFHRSASQNGFCGTRHTDSL